jgi:transposase
MSKHYALSYKQQIIERLTGRNAMSARQVAREAGLGQPTVSRWLREARTLPPVAGQKRGSRQWSIEEKVRVLAAGSKLTGSQLTQLLEREGLVLAEFERWRLALDSDNPKPSVTATRRIRALEREVARKDKALAEAAALLILKKKAELLWGVVDDDTDEESEK